MKNIKRLRFSQNEMFNHIDTIVIGECFNQNVEHQGMEYHNYFENDLYKTDIYVIVSWNYSTGKYYLESAYIDIKGKSTRIFEQHHYNNGYTLPYGTNIEEYLPMVQDAISYLINYEEDYKWLKNKPQIDGKKLKDNSWVNDFKFDINNRTYVDGSQFVNYLLSGQKNYCGNSVFEIIY